jgi:hypothetical protein
MKTSNNKQNKKIKLDFNPENSKERKELMKLVIKQVVKRYGPTLIKLGKE